VQDEVASEHRTCALSGAAFWRRPAQAPVRWHEGEAMHQAIGLVGWKAKSKSAVTVLSTVQRWRGGEPASRGSRGGVQATMVKDSAQRGVENVLTKRLTVGV